MRGQQDRHPSGTSLGGRFAAGNSPEVDVDDDEQDFPDAQPAAEPRAEEPADKAVRACADAEDPLDVYRTYVSSCGEAGQEPQLEVLNKLAAAPDAQAARTVLKEQAAASEAFDEKTQRKAVRAEQRTGKPPIERLTRRHDRARAKRGLPAGASAHHLRNYGVMANSEVGARAIETFFARMRSGRF